MALLPYDPESLQPLVRELDEWQTKLDYRGPLPRTWAGRLRRDLQAESVAASTIMEGVGVTVDEVRRILAGDRPAKVKPEDADLVEGYRDAMGFVLRRADDPGFRWNRELIVALHDRVLASKYSEGAGRLRESAVRVVDRDSGAVVFQPPPPEEVGGVVDEACVHMEEVARHPAIASAWIHVAIAAVHPFRDGNGRSARVLASLAMYRGGFKLPAFTSLEEWWGNHVAGYYAAFACLGELFSPDAEVTPFLHAHLQAQLSQVRALDLREQVQRRIWQAIEEMVVDVGLQARAANAVWEAFFGRDVTPRYYRPTVDVSEQTATNDLAGCVTAGFLEPHGAGRSRHYAAAAGLHRMVGGRLDLTVDEEPVTARAYIAAEVGKRITP